MESIHLANVTATITRPADTAAYAALDAISNSTSAPTAITLSDVAPVVGTNGGSGYITKARIMTNKSSITPRLKLHLFNTVPTAINDNAAHTLLWANRATRVGSITFPAMATEGTGSDAAEAICTPGTGGVALSFKCANGDQNLYGLLETLDIFTPNSGQIFYIELMIDSSVP